MTTVFLVRHGSVDGMRERLTGRSDIGLNTQGRSEAARAADACRRLGVGIVASSPRRRARETAEIIRGALLLAESRSWSSWSLDHPEPASITPVRWADGR